MLIDVVHYLRRCVVTVTGDRRTTEFLLRCNRSAIQHGNAASALGTAADMQRNRKLGCRYEDPRSEDLSKICTIINPTHYCNNYTTFSSACMVADLIICWEYLVYKSEASKQNEEKNVSLLATNGDKDRVIISVCNVHCLSTELCFIKKIIRVSSYFSNPLEL